MCNPVLLSSQSASLYSTNNNEEFHYGIFLLDDMILFSDNKYVIGIFDATINFFSVFASLNIWKNLRLSVWYILMFIRNFLGSPPMSERSRAPDREPWSKLRLWVQTPAMPVIFHHLIGKYQQGTLIIRAMTIYFFGRTLIKV